MTSERFQSYSQNIIYVKLTGRKNLMTKKLIKKKNKQGKDNTLNEISSELTGENRIMGEVTKDDIVNKKPKIKNSK